MTKQIITFPLIFLMFLLNGKLISQSVLPANAQKQKVIMLADMGNEPDEEQQNFHLLLYSNEIDLRGLIAVTGKFLNPNSTNPAKKRLYPELFLKLIEGYSKVYDNLQKHAQGWPTPAYLKTIVAKGQTGYGIDDVGDGKASEGSKIIVNTLKEDSTGTVYVIVNAGSNTLAQALWDLRQAFGLKGMEKYVQRLRVFENGAQDNAGAWICKTFPSIDWIRSNYQTYCYGGPGVDGGFDNKGKGNELGPYTWKPYPYSPIGQHQWLLENIIGNHGPYGRYYPLRQFDAGGIAFMEGGGTIPFLGLVNKGLYDINHHNWGGWSGRYSSEKTENCWSKHQSVKVDEDKYTPFLMYTEERDSWNDIENGVEYTDNLFAPVWRWRRAFQNDFQCRMDWATKPYSEANHNPIAAFNGDKTDNIITIKAKPGEIIKLDASASSDPDGDELEYQWYNYKEAGSYSKVIPIMDANKPITSVTIPDDAGSKEIHIILEVRDKSKIAAMYDYRRVVIDVK